MGNKRFSNTSLPDDYTEQMDGKGFAYAVPNGGPSDTYGAAQTRRENSRLGNRPKHTIFSSLGYPIALQSILILPSNNKRNYLLFQNRGQGTIFLAFGVAAISGSFNAVEITAGGKYEIRDPCPVNDVFASSDSSSILSVQQGLLM